MDIADVDQVKNAPGVVVAAVPFVFPSGSGYYTCVLRPFLIIEVEGKFSRCQYSAPK